MKRIIRVLVILGLAVILPGCSIRHVVSDDYTQYLVNNEGNSLFPQTDYVAEYVLTPNTTNHNYEFRSVTTGYANLWVVRFGEILEKTLESRDVQSAFRTFSKAQGEGSPGILIIKYNLVDYQFEGFEARLTLQISALKDNAVIFNERYYEKGISQGGKMFWAGAFGMKNAIQQSTKNAIDKILARSIHDMKAKL
jgi:hypothetical protein